MAGVLLIDDSTLARKLVRNILQNKGYTVCGEASDGRKGLEKSKKLKPDLVFCDILMNEMNGVECLQAILAYDPGARVVICTSVGDELHANEASQAGARGFIVKPINAEEVIRVTEMLIGKPAPVPKKNYRDLMEERAEAEGIGGKPLLDFFEAFRQFNGFGIDSAKVDGQYLADNAARLTIGIRALLSAKMSSAQAERLLDIFRELS